MGERELMFHLVWIGPNDREFYTKRIDFDATETPARLVNSISIPPSRRTPGRYTLRVYLFRELIAEKDVLLQLPPAGEEM
jgi:hypothetical protein